MDTKNGRTKLGAFRERAISVAALVDPRTLRKAIRGGRVNPMVLARIESALEAEGLGHLLPPGVGDERIVTVRGRSCL